MQVLQPHGTITHNSVLRNIFQVARTEGVFSLWRGMSSVIVGAGTFLPCCRLAIAPVQLLDFSFSLLATDMMLLQVLPTLSTLRPTKPSNMPWAAIRSASTTLLLLVSLALYSNRSILARETDSILLQPQVAPQLRSLAMPL